MPDRPPPGPDEEAPDGARVVANRQAEPCSTPADDPGFSRESCEKGWAWFIGERLAAFPAASRGASKG